MTRTNPAHTLSTTPFEPHAGDPMQSSHSGAHWVLILPQSPRLVAVPFPSAMRVNVATQPMALAMGDPLTYFGLAGFELWDTDAATTGTPKSGEGFQAFARTIDGRDGEFDNLPVVLVTVEREAMPPQTRRDTLLRVTLTDSGDDEIDSAVVDGWAHAVATADAMDSAYFASHENAPPPYSRPETTAELIVEYRKFCSDHNLPHVSADEQELPGAELHYDECPADQRTLIVFNEEFIGRWENAQEIEDAQWRTEQESKR